eukprot:CAMPEP_0168343106 /NCGR_PEP_ID=MMETSP0213-20121227/15847_1 /TAXON_ID=151035 /ORGANISM="Euplotes harpa, Strain FSP1.4" /LENGTH=51 /DNA_ID=CAMNT_0008350241 /DNA_START=248 /DNA_END=403 /DNA_ORIENTATION=-
MNENNNPSKTYAKDNGFAEEEEYDDEDDEEDSNPKKKPIAKREPKEKSNKT